MTVSSSGTATGYFTYNNHFYKVEWSGINTSETTSVKFHCNTYGKLTAETNGTNGTNGNYYLFADSNGTDWTLPYITNLTPSQSSDGYTFRGELATGANVTSNPIVFKKVCTVTCMAANAPTWNWSADYSTCTATFTCAANTSLTATVNATVTESNGSKTAAVTFNGQNYSDTKNTTCTVTWKNDDGTVLKTDTVAYNSTPSYGGTPTKAGNAQYSYTFSGWSPAVSAVTSDTTYTAQYSRTTNSYTVTWKNADGSTLKTDTVEYGKTPSYSGTPTKAGDAQYSYTFSGWSPAITSVTGNQTYTAQYSSTVNKYTVTWKNGDTTLETDTNVSYGATPTYDGAIPTKASDDKYSYTFKDWSPSVSTVSGNVTYTAQFTKAPIAAHFSLNGDTYTIHDETGWDVFCDCLNDNDTYNRFSGKTVKLDADITVSTMAGSQYHDFCGTFDGQGHTLTFNYGTSDNYSSDEYIAPFKYISTVTPDGGTEIPTNIINLHVNGDIYTSAKYAAGLIAQHWGTVNIENCRSSIIIHSKVSGDGTHGGFEAVASGTLNIKGCVFDGKLLTTGTTDTGNCAGFAAWGGENVNISDSLYAPADIDTATGEKEVVTGTGDYPGRTFARKTTGSVSNSYYTRTLGIEQGKQGHTITAGQDVTVALSGETANYKNYDVSGISTYGTELAYNGTIYAGEGDEVTLTLEHNTPTGYSTAYTASAGTLENGVLTMPDNDVVISANDTINKYTVTLPENMEITNGVTLTDGKANYGTEIKFKSKDGYTASNVKANGTDLTATDGVYTVTVEGDVTVSAEFIRYTLVPAVEPTYTEAGNSEYYIGSDGKYYVLDGSKYTEIEEDSWVLPMLTLVHHEAVAPTCTEDGTVEYWHDEALNKYFSDANGENEITNIVDPATGHNYSTPIWSWANNGKGYTATMKSVCSKCGNIETHKATVTSTTADGVITYTATAAVDGVEYTSVQQVNVSYTFSVVDGTITKGEKDSYSYGDAVVVQADESKDGKYFSGWYVGNTRITTKQSYTFYVKSNMTVTAKYEGAAVQEEQADVSVMITRTNIANNKQKVVFSLNWALPTGCKLKEAGIVRRYDSAENLTLANVDGSDIKKGASTLKTQNGNCNFNMTVSATTKLRSINAVAYVIYTDKNGVEQTVYSTVQTSAYAY